MKGRDVQSTVKDIQSILDEKLKLPEGYYYNYGGEFQNLQSATQRLIIVVPVALIIILLLLYATVKNLRESLFVFSAIPLAAIGGVWALWLRGMPFSISAGVGFIALFGVAVLNGIVLIGQMNQIQKQAAAVPEENDASLAAVIQNRIIDSCMIRLRPVLMTALVASMGFLPMALSHGDGAEVQRPLATVVIGGLITSTLLTLLVLPAIYKMFTKSKISRYENNEQKKIIKNRVVACFAAILLLLPATVGAQHFDAHIAGRKVTLQECFDLAARQNLQMQAGKKSVERAQVMQGTAWELDKTEVAFSQNPATGGESDNGFTFTQSLDFPTVYATRRNQLKAETQAEKSRLNVVSQQLKAEIANTYYQMLYQTHRLQILERIDSVLERYSQIAEMRYKAGESRQLEYLSADRKCNENRLEMADVKSEIERLQIDLMTQLNTQEPIKPAEENLSAIAAQNLNSYNYQQSADGIYQQDKLIALDKEIKAAKSGFAPSLSLSLRTQCVISSWNPYNIDRSRFSEGNFFGFEIGVGIPLFYGSTKAK